MSNPLNHRADETQARERGIPKWKVIAFFMALYDFVAVCGAYFLELFFRFDGLYSAIPSYYLEPYEKFIFPCAAASIVIFFLCRMYNGMWRYASFADFIRTFIGSMISSILHTILITVLFMRGAPFKRMPYSYYILGAGFQFIFLVAIRFAARFFYDLKRTPYADGDRFRRQTGRSGLRRGNVHIALRKRRTSPSDPCRLFFRHAASDAVRRSDATPSRPLPCLTKKSLDRATT